MDNNKKNIDRLFQEKFKDFEVAPNDAVWDRISESLPNKKKKRRVIALWWQIGGVAAVLALLFTAGVSILGSDTNSNQDFPVVNTDKSDFENKQNQDTLDAVKSYKQDALKKATNNSTDLVGSESQNASNLERQKKRTSKNDSNSDAFTVSNKTLNNSVANSSNEKETISTSQMSYKLTRSNKFNSNSSIVANTKTPNNSTKQKSDVSLVSENKLKSVINKNIKDQNTATVENTMSDTAETQSSTTKNTENVVTDESDLDSVIIEDTLKESIQDAIAAQNEDINEEEKEDEQNRWSIAPNVAPVYYSSLGQGSSLDQQFNDNAKGSDINMSYGITGAYAVSKKLKIRAGINRVNLNQSTSNVFAFSGPESTSRNSQIIQPSANSSFSSNSQNILLMSSDMLGTSSAPEVFNTQEAGDLDQRFGFIEVPLELEYRLVDTKFGINVIGGFSTLFLNQNEIFADIDGSSTLIGEANNINSTSFSANFGLGLDYSLSKQWNINLEPQFKYQINTFNNTSGDFRPFFIGIYTGLSFKF